MDVFVYNTRIIRIYIYIRVHVRSISYIYNISSCIKYHTHINIFLYAYNIIFFFSKIMAQMKKHFFFSTPHTLGLSFFNHYHTLKKWQWKDKTSS